MFVDFLLLALWAFGLERACLGRSVNSHTDEKLQTTLQEQQNMKRESPASSDSPAPPDHSSSRLESCFLDFLSFLCAAEESFEAPPAPLNLTQLSQLPRVSRLLFCLVGCYRQCCSGFLINKRAIFYSQPRLFNGRQANSDRTVEKLSAITELNRMQLKVIASAKGFCQGAIEFVAPDDPTAATIIGCASPAQIPSLAENIRNIKFLAPVDLIIVIEKDTVFRELSASGFSSANRALLLTGRGFPDFGTRAFLQKILRQKPELSEQLYGLFDSDAYGLDIYACYRSGASGGQKNKKKREKFQLEENSSEPPDSQQGEEFQTLESSVPTFPTLRFLGLSLSDFSDSELERFGERMSENEILRLASLERRVMRSKLLQEDFAFLSALSEFRVRCGGGWRVELESLKLRGGPAAEALGLEPARRNETLEGIKYRKFIEEKLEQRREQERTEREQQQDRVKIEP